MAQRQPDVVISEGRLGAWTDNLAAKYSAVAGDGKADAKLREAAALIAVVESHFVKEEAAEAMKAAKEALAYYSGAANKEGTADATRLVVHVQCCTSKVAEGLKTAQEQLTAFKEAGDKAGEAKMLLSLAEAQLAKGSCDLALASVEAALGIFKAEGNKQMVATSQLMLAQVHLAKPGDTQKKSEDAKSACDEAMPIFKDMGQATAEAFALHLSACSRALGGAPESALRAGKEAMAIYEKEELKKQTAFELRCIATWHLAGGDMEEACTAAEEALDVFGDDMYATQAEACAMQTLVQCYLEDKEPQDALEVAKNEMERFEEAENIAGVAACQEMAMLAYYTLGSYDRAMRYANTAAETLEKAGDKKSQGRVMRTVCTLHRAKGHHEPALKAAQEALQIFEDLEDTMEQAVTLLSRADTYMEKKEHGRALALAQEACELYQDAGNVEGEVSALLQIAAANFMEGDFKKAAASAKEAQAKAGDAGDRSGESNALRALVEVNVVEKDFDAALRTLGLLLALTKEAGDRVEEVNTMVMTVRALIMQYVQKDEEGKGNEKLQKSVADKATKMAKDALSIARKLDDNKQALAAALFTVGQSQVMNGKMPEAMKAAEEALGLFKDCNLVAGEASTYVLMADIHLYNRDMRKAREQCEEGVYLFQRLGDVEMEDQAWTEIERIDKVEGEIRAAEEQQRQMSMMAQAQQWQMQQGQDLLPIPQQQFEEAAPSAAAGYEAKLVKLDVGAGLDPVQLKQQILEITKGLIGDDEDIEYDMPLMESGLTSNTAVLLRDALTQQLPGVNLPVTLVFDYPSIEMMSELIVENAAKAAKKAAKALKG